MAVGLKHSKNLPTHSLYSGIFIRFFIDHPLGSLGNLCLVKQSAAFKLTDSRILCLVVSGKLDGGDAVVALSEQKMIVGLNNLGVEEGVNRTDSYSGRHGSVHLNELRFDMKHRSIGERNTKEHPTVRNLLGKYARRHARSLTRTRSGNLYPHKATFYSATSSTIGELRKSNASLICAGIVRPESSPFTKSWQILSMTSVFLFRQSS